MTDQPFDAYKNKNVEYDYIIDAKVNVKDISDTEYQQIIYWLNDEDYVSSSFPKLGLGMVYGKVFVDNSLRFKFGISLVDAIERPTDTELLNNVKDFILRLNKNIENNNFNIQESDIKLDMISENKYVNNVDKLLITEGSICLAKADDVHSFKLTDDGIVEHYNNNNLNSTFPFAKLTLTRECKQLIQDGYRYVPTSIMKEDMNDAMDTKAEILKDPEKAKQTLQDEIDLVDELQAKQNELDDKLNNLLGESKEYPEFPSNEFSEEPVIYDDLNVETFNEFLTSEQKAYINAYIGTIDEFVQAMQLLYDEVGDGVAPLISINEYIKEILCYDGGISEWTQELSDMLGLDLKTEGKSKFYTAENAFDDFIKNIKENENKDEDGYYDFKMQDLGITKEATAEFKNLLLQRDEIEDVQYDPQNNMYKVKLADDKSSKEEKIEENKVQEVNNLSRLYQHTKDKSTFAIIGSQDKDTKQDRSSELKSEIGKVQRQFKNIGYNTLEGTYTYENGEQGIENSYIIYNIPKNTAIDIANKLNQESITWKDDNYFGFLNADGSEDSKFKNNERNLTFDDQITNMFGSKFTNGSNRLAFAFECKLIETTETGSDFSKQGKKSIVKFPICKIDVPKSDNI